MEPEAVRREFHAQAADVRATLADRWGTVPTRERTIPALDDEPPEQSDEAFPWTAVCIVTKGENVLMIQEAGHGTLEWKPAGGNGRRDERPADTARREVRRKTGVTCDVTDLLLVEVRQFHYGGNEPYPIVQPVFAGPYIGGEAAARQGTIESTGWFDACDLPANAKYRSFIENHAGETPE